VYGRISRCIPAFSLLVIAVVGLTACGSGMPGDVVVQIGDSSISKPTLAHWTSIEGALVYENNPRQPVPKGVVPDPPGYAACIAYLEATAPKPIGSRSTLTAAQLKSRCRQKYKALQQHVLDILISSVWQDDAGAEQGITVTDKEAEQELERFKRREYPRKGEFQRFLAFSGLSVADELSRIKRNMLATRLQRSIAKKELTVRQQRALAEAFTKKWTARTSCRAGYVVPGCKQYKGTQSLL